MSLSCSELEPATLEQRLSTRGAFTTQLLQWGGVGKLRWSVLPTCATFSDAANRLGFMPTLHIKMPLQNEGSSPVKVVLEPLSEYFFVKPGQRIEVHAICAADTDNRSFTIAPGDSLLTIYAPGEMAGFVDCYVTEAGERLVPDGN